MKKGIKMLLQVLSGLSHHAVHALVDPLEEFHHCHSWSFLFGCCCQVNHI